MNKFSTGVPTLINSNRTIYWLLNPPAAHNPTDGAATTNHSNKHNPFPIHSPERDKDESQRQNLPTVKLAVKPKSQSISHLLCIAPLRACKSDPPSRGTEWRKNPKETPTCISQHVRQITRIHSHSLDYFPPLFTRRAGHRAMPAAPILAALGTTILALVGGAAKSGHAYELTCAPTET